MSNKLMSHLNVGSDDYEVCDATARSAGFVDTVNLKDGAVTSGKLASGAVTSGKISDGAVDNGKLASNAVTSGKISNGSVNTVKIADGAVTTVKIADANVTTVKIADGAVTTVKIADDAVTSGKIADANVTAGKLASSAVETAKIKDGAVTTDKLAGSAVTEAKIAANSVNTNIIKDGNVTTAKLADSAVSTAKIANSAVTPAKMHVFVQDINSKNHLNYYLPLNLQNCTFDINTGTVTATISDTRTEFLGIAQLYKDGVYVSPTIKLTNTSFRFTKMETFNEIVFGHSGSQNDIKITYDISNLKNGQMYCLSFDLINSTNPFSWHNMMLRENYEESEGDFVPYAKTNADLSKISKGVGTKSSSAYGNSPVWYKIGNVANVVLNSIGAVAGASVQTVLATGLPKPVTTQYFSIPAAGYSGDYPLVLSIDGTGSLRLIDASYKASVGYYGSITYMTME